MININVRKTLLASLGAILIVAWGDLGFAHDPNGEWRVPDQNNLGGCIDETSPHDHDANGENRWIGGVQGVHQKPCPRYHAASYVDQIVAAVDRKANSNASSAANNAARIEDLTSQLAAALERIQLLETELETTSNQLRQTQLTVTSHRSDFTQHKHDTDGVASGLPYYP